MKLKLSLSTALTLLFASISGVALAGGTHAGGHAGENPTGQAGKSASVNRTITVNMTDTMRFSPQSISVKQGETIKFVVKNSGKVKHEMVLGTEKELKDHYEEMKKNPEMEHDDDNQITVQPGKVGQIIWQFTKAGKVNFGCLQVGHFEAGMKGFVAVAKSSVSASKHSGHKH